MKRHIVCLTFDHDHLSGFIARGLTSPTAISRGEYDMVVIPRLVALLGRHDIKATFFTPGHTIDSPPQAVMPYIEAGHELAHHGWTHRPPVSLSREEEEEEIVRGNAAIKRVSGQTARGRAQGAVRARPRDATGRDADQLVAGRLSALRIHAQPQRLDPGRVDERHQRSREFRRRLHLHDPGSTRFRHSHLYLPSACHRSGPSHDDA